MSMSNDPAAAQAARGDSVSTNNTRAAAIARPVSPRKRAANRANAARSTGPRTVTGKARVSMNAVRHGLAAQAALLPGEDPEELAALARAYEADLRPRGAMERDLVARIVGINWRLRRVARAEEAMWARQDNDIVDGVERGVMIRESYGMPQMPWEREDDEPAAPMTGAEYVAGEFCRISTSGIERLAVYEQRLDRALHAAVRELRVVRELRRAGMGFDEDDEDGMMPATVEAAGSGGEVREHAPPADAVAKTQAADGGASGGPEPCAPVRADDQAVGGEPRKDAGRGTAKCRRA